MNTGQMLIGIAALGLVTYTILNFNRGSISTQDALIYNKEFIIASTVAQSMLDEISSKAYDENIVSGKKVTSANDFSSNLKTDSGEIYPEFDDVDDFNGFTKIDTIPKMGIFYTNVKVDYVTDGLVETKSKTYNKKVTVTVTSPTLINFYTEEADSVVFSSLFSQWVML